MWVANQRVIQACSKQLELFNLADFLPLKYVIQRTWGLAAIRTVWCVWKQTILYLFFLSCQLASFRDSLAIRTLNRSAVYRYCSGQVGLFWFLPHQLVASFCWCACVLIPLQWSPEMFIMAKGNIWAEKIIIIFSVFFIISTRREAVRLCHYIQSFVFSTASQTWGPFQVGSKSVCHASFLEVSGSFRPTLPS